MSTLKEKYENEVLPKLQESLGMTNRLRAPRLQKVVVNMGIGIKDKDTLKSVTDDLARITGQKPVLNKARKSVSNFRLREGMVVGAKVTLRGAHMYEFMDRLVNAALPRIRDFRGLSPEAFDGNGNYTLGVREQTIFPEIDPDTVKETQGMDVSIVTSAQNDDEARELLSLLGMPFAEPGSQGGQGVG